MLDALKPLVVVLALALIAFALAKPVCLRFMVASDFARRRNVWIVLTCTAFAAPNLWLFALVALPLVYWAAAVDRHPTALYVFIFLTVPHVSIPIPMPVINKLFELGPSRILSLALLIPVAVRILQSGGKRPPGLARADLAVLAWGLLQLVLYMPYESITNTMRRAVLFGLDTYVLYFVFSRATVSREALRDTLASFWVACAILAPIVVFESMRGWLLFTGIPSRWGDPNMFSWLFRDDALRAQGPAGHSLTMGFVLATAFGFWLYLGSQLPRRLVWAVGVVIWAGLFATFSRAPWIVAVFVMFAYLAISPSGRRHIVGTSIKLAVGVAALSLTPFGQRIISSLPFIGTVEQGNVSYRQQVAETSWRLIRQNPFFGDPFATRYMQDLKQGQGIIDIVNTYASVGVFYGLVGLALFTGCFIYPMVRTAMASFASRGGDPEDGNLGAVLVAATLGVLLMMATASFGGPFEQSAWALAGLCSAYPAVVRQRSTIRQSSADSQGLPQPAMRSVRYPIR
jgi:O-Antigen ligase